MEQSIDIVVKETVTETVTVDRELAEMVRELVISGLNEAKTILEFGLADQKLQIIRTLLSGATRTLGKDFTSHEQEARVALDRMFARVRNINDAGPEAITAGIDDSDEGSDYREVPD